MNRKDLIVRLAKEIRKDGIYTGPIRDVDEAADVIYDHLNSAMKRRDFCFKTLKDKIMKEKESTKLIAKKPAKKVSMVAPPKKETKMKK